MRSFSVGAPHVKDFMRHLFTLGTFDAFEARAAEIFTFARFEISGEKEGGYCAWAELKPYVRHIIQGEKKPRFIKLVFSRSRADTEALHPNAAALFLNITYENDRVAVTTGTAQKVFNLDKQPDGLWEHRVAEFFKENKIEVNVE
jgi:hypothetical protein